MKSDEVRPVELVLSRAVYASPAFTNHTATCHRSPVRTDKQRQNNPVIVRSSRGATDVNILSRRFLCKFCGSIIHKLNCYLYEIASLCLCRSRINDLSGNAVCSISRLRAEGRQLTSVYTVYTANLFIQLKKCILQPFPAVYFNFGNVLCVSQRESTAESITDAPVRAFRRRAGPAGIYAVPYGHAVLPGLMRSVWNLGRLAPLTVMPAHVTPLYKL